LGFTCLLILVGGFGAWAASTSITGAVISHGRVEVAQNRQVVQHLDGGVVAEILVQEGNQVEADQLLIRLDDRQLRSELAVVEGQLLEILARRARLEAEEKGATELSWHSLLLETSNPVAQELMDGAETLFRAKLETEERQVEQLRRQQDQIADQIKGIQSQQEAIAEQITLVGQELVAQQSLLDRQLAQSARVMELEREEANLTGRQGELASALAQAEGKITEIEISILRIESERREEASTALRDLGFNQIELTEQRQALLTRLDRLDIRAPVGGVVYGLAVFAPRSVVRAAEPILYLVPQDRPLLIATQVEPIHVDQVHVGQEVQLRLAAFDQRTTPELRGRIVQISADAFQDEASRMSYYRAEVQIEDGELAKLPEGMTLIPGMPVEAFIRTGERSPLSFLTKPLTDYFAKAFRET
jgi:HlyD family secretion protein